MWGVPAIICALAALRDPSFLVGLASCILAFAGFAVTFGVRRIEIQGDTITYRTLTGTRSIKISEIQNAEMKTGIGASWADLLRGPIRLEIQPWPYTGKKVLRINTKPFRRDDVEMLLSFVSSRQ
jgi:hypothetical protein